jgi:hypothetical protein
VPTVHGLPVVIDQPTLHSLAQPILDKAVATSLQAIAAADAPAVPVVGQRG